MIKVFFCDEIDDEFLKYAVIAARYKNKWIFCRHKERISFELPGGHRESGEDIESTAKRELYEETGAVKFTLKKVTIYCVENNTDVSFGALYYAEVEKISERPDDTEIGENVFEDKIPEPYTYPDIQPYLCRKIEAYTGLTMI